MIKAVGHVGLQVPNLDRSVQWATTVMGLREVTREGGPLHHLLHGGALPEGRRKDGATHEEELHTPVIGR